MFKFIFSKMFLSNLIQKQIQTFSRNVFKISRRKSWSKTPMVFLFKSPIESTSEILNRDRLRISKISSEASCVFGSIFELKAFENGIFLVVDERGNVKTFSNVNAEIKHLNHLLKFILVRGTQSDKRHCLIVDAKSKQHPTSCLFIGLSGHSFIDELTNSGKLRPSLSNMSIIH